MPDKDQLYSYRVIDGERYINAGDVLAPAHETAIALVKRLRLRHRVFRHPDGFKRLFVLEADHAKHQAEIAAAFSTEATHG